MWSVLQSSTRTSCFNLRRCCQWKFFYYWHWTWCSPTDFSSLLAFATPSSWHPLVSLGDPSPTWPQDARYVSASCNRMLRQEIESEDTEMWAAICFMWQFRDTLIALVVLESNSFETLLNLLWEENYTTSVDLLHGCSYRDHLFSLHTRQFKGLFTGCCVTQQRSGQ